MNDKTKKVLGLAVLAIVAGIGMAQAVSVNRTRRDLIASRDASGYPIVNESDRAWKVFEIAGATTETQVTDEDGVAPKMGVLHKVCIESAAYGFDATHWGLVWDTAAATAASVPYGVTGRRLLPPLTRASGAMVCETVDALFTLGLRGVLGNANGSMYIYWRDLGGRR